MNEQPRLAIALQWLTMMFRRVTAVLLTLRVRTVCWQLVWATLAAEISKSASSCLYTSRSITVSVWEERRCYRVPFARALPGSGGACGRNRPHALASESLPSLAPSRSAVAAVPIECAQAGRRPGGPRHVQLEAPRHTLHVRVQAGPAPAGGGRPRPGLGPCHSELGA